MIFLFMLSIYGFGFKYNDIFRIGAIFPSDIILLGLVISLFIRERKVHMSKNIAYAILVAMWELTLGLVARNSFGYILRDLKIFVYFIGVYWLMKSICKNEYYIKKIYKYYIIVVIISIVFNLSNFFINGLVNIEKGEILRTFAIGLGWGAVVPIFLIINTYKERFVERYGIILYYVIEFLSIICIGLSYTRSLWISTIIAFALKKIIVDKTRLNTNMLIKMGLMLIITIMIFGGLYKSQNSIFLAIYNRFGGISESIKGESSTIVYRIEDVASSFYKLKSPRIFWGYGFGDTRLPYSYRALTVSEETNCENSYFYYLWKYGLVLTLILLLLVSCKLRTLWYGTKGAKVWVVYLIVFMTIGAMSGNLNNNYGVAIYALYFILATHVEVGLKTFGIGDRYSLKY